MLTKHKQRFTVVTAIFFAYGGSLAFPVIYEKETTAQKLTKPETNPDVLKALLEKIKNSEALARIFLDSLDDTRYRDFPGSRSPLRKGGHLPGRCCRYTHESIELQRAEDAICAEQRRHRVRHHHWRPKRG